eukprot:TRINITY_DN280_c0_g1_i2.p1 TRINITY_DN280_c0_g1~~TRINITY_DN280_c0_g1_i2.p1  ORF type:complete len:166 (-),score=28.29 TRINITY_DN280_c0_g1_i2:675-1172(-)
MFSRDSQIYRIQLWDAPGAGRFLKLTSRLCAGATAGVVVFDVTKRSSFDKIEDWTREIERTGPIPKILVGNKCDEATREVSEKQAAALALKLGMKYFETSANKRTGVNEAFETLYLDIISSIPSVPEPSLLLKRSIRIGRKLAESAKYRQALFAPESATDRVDWF